MKLFKWPQLHRDWAKEKRVSWLGSHTLRNIVFFPYINPLLRTNIRSGEYEEGCEVFCFHLSARGGSNHIEAGVAGVVGYHQLFLSHILCAVEYLMILDRQRCCEW